MLSAYPPERLEVELQSRLGPSLAERGYRVVGHGSSGVSWRREMSGKVIAGLVLLGLVALGGLASGTAGSMAFGLVCLIGAGLLLYFRRPATLTIALTPVEGGTKMTVRGGPDVERAEQIARAVAGRPLSQPLSGGEAPRSL